MEIFKEFDENQDGSISNKEFIQALQIFDITLTAAE